MTTLANIGIPMIVVQWPLMFATLVPVVVLETLVIHRRLRVSWRSALLGVGKANVLSTLIGVPLAWLLMFGLELGIFIPFSIAVDRWEWQVDGPIWSLLGSLVSAAWIVPDKQEFQWLASVAIAVLLVPCFFLSVAVERRSCLQTWREVSPEDVRRGVFIANLMSYSLLFLLACVWGSFHVPGGR